MGVAHQIVSTILIVNVVSCFIELKFEVDPSLTGKVCPVGRRLFEGTVASFLSCAVAAEEAGSAGLVYIKETSMCYGCDVISMYNTGDFLNLPGAVFCRRGPAYTTTTMVPPTSPTTTVNPLAEFVDVGGYLLKFVNSGLSYTAAESACAAYGGLVKINTADKQSAIENFLLDNTNDYNGFAYWIQCWLDTGDVWRFDDGSPVPMTSTFWAPGEPSDTTGRCGDMWQQVGYKWDNAGCHANIGYICDAP